MKENVARGAALLDQRAPGWEKRIKLQDLDMSCYMECVLGQLFGSYVKGVCFLFPGADTEDRDVARQIEIAHGFELDRKTIEEGDFLDLDALWTEEVEKRLG